MKNLQLPLIEKWFRMTNSGEKPEDYRLITPYWIKRFVILFRELDYIEFEDFCTDLENPLERHHSLEGCLKYWGAEFKQFKNNIMTLGYPKAGTTERIITLEHNGIEIRTGNPEWGAVPGTNYFVIKHGSIVK